MKYKVGDKVRVRKDLEVGKEYGHLEYLSLMGLKGNVVTIKKVNKNSYELEEDMNKFCWDESMFEKPKSKYITIKEKTLKKYQDEAKENLELSLELTLENTKLKGQVETYEKMLKIKEEIC